MGAPGELLVILDLMSGLRDFSVVYFGNDWFAENRTSSHHIARRLGNVVPVLYIESPGSRSPQKSARDFRKLWRKLARALAPPQKVHENFHVATIPQIPFRSLPGMDRLNLRLGIFLARRAMRKLGFKQRISWFVVPHPGPLAKRLGETLAVYYCIDDYASYPGMDAAAIQALDDDLTRRADVVFVAPRALVESKRLLNPNVYFSPHGVDFELFSQAANATTEPAEDARALKHPVIGYFGTIGEFIDFDLIAYLAESRPDWTFLLVGFAAADVSRLKKYPNVVFVGPKPYETLPRWAKVFDVAIYAHQVNRQTRHSNPLKLREYLATGKPVVSVVTPETACFAEFVYLAETREAYLMAIEQALREDAAELRRKRMDAVAGVSWDARFQETTAVVEKMLAARVR
jgi:glycosyltransferase involved in cell wall biosynthesis